MLIVVLLLCLATSVYVALRRRDSLSLYLLGMSLCSLAMLAGIVVYIAKIGGTAAQQRTLLVQMEDRKITYGPDTLQELEIAYAITVHKSQGTEFTAVVMPLSGVPTMLRYRNLLYTGVTRAKKLCVLPGELSVMEEMVANVQKNKRYSCLGALLNVGTAQCS